MVIHPLWTGTVAPFPGRFQNGFPMGIPGWADITSNDTENQGVFFLTGHVWCGFHHHIHMYLYIYIYIYLQPSFAGTHISWMGDNSFLDLLEDYVINKSSYPIPLQWKLPRGNFPLKHQSLVGGDWNHGILGCSIREESSQLDELHHFPEGFKPPIRLTLAFSIPRLMTPDGRCSLNYTQFDYPFQSLFIIMCI